jgi:hypothetical protein
MRFNTINKGSCVGFADIRVPEFKNMEIFGITLYEKDGKRWINFPSKMYEAEGVKKYSPYFRFPEKEDYDNFCSDTKRAIELKLEDSNVPF